MDASRRHRIAEALPPAVLPLLEQLGAREDVEAAGFLRPSEAVVRWAGRTWRRRTWGDSQGLHVNRGVFDQLLLSAAMRAGVRVIHSARVRRLACEGSGGWSIEADTPEGPRMVRATFSVDASGRGGLLRGQKRRLSADTVALSGHWADVRIDGEHSRTEAGQDCWYWAGALPDGSWSATVFVAPDRLKPRHGDLAEVYVRLLADSELLSGLTSGRLISAVRACSATPEVDDGPVGVGWIKVGDAALAHDPLSSQGVQSALSHALAAACVVHTLLTETVSPDVPLSFYADRIRHAAEHHRRLAGAQYHEQNQHSPSPFWAARSVTPVVSPIVPRDFPRDPNRVLVRAAEARLRPTPVVDGDVIRLMRAVEHPRIDGAVAFLGRDYLPPLVETMETPKPLRELLCEWSALIPPDRASLVLAWLWRHHVIEEAENTRPVRPVWT
jgi:flavin-dependent dehydrogenase